MSTRSAGLLWRSGHSKISPVMPAPDTRLKCLLCSHEHLKVLASLTGREIRKLWHERDLVFPPEALAGIDEDSSVILWACARCGFQFFDSALAGNSLFYELLEPADYYSPDRPEFQRTTRFAVKHRLRNVLDVGCGTGSFLDLARQAGLQTFGLELNPKAAGKARAKGHQIFDRLLHELPPDACPGGFDMITLFQVLEHVPDPVGILNEAYAQLKPGGFISIAVPNKLGIGRFMPWDPAQWPPHHISRWGLPDFKTLASRTNLRLETSGGDLLLGTAINHTFSWHTKLSAAINRRPVPKAGAWLGLFSWGYRKSGMKYFAPRWGSSIYAFFQKSENVGEHP